MIKLVCLTLPYAQFPVERALEGVARAGYRYVGLGWPHEKEDILGFDPDGARVRRCLSLCEKAGLTPLVVGRGPMNASERAEKLRGRIGVAKALGAELIQMAGAGGYRRFPNEPLEPEVFQKAHCAYVKDLKAVGSYAEEAGITLALKPHTGNTATAAHLKTLLPEIGSPAVRACYDPGNVHYYEGISPEDDFPLIADQTAEIVAKDHRGPRAANDFPAPGEGDIDFKRIFTTAREAGFNGPVIVERVNGTGGPLAPEDIDQRVAHARENLERLLVATGLLGAT